MLVSESAMKHKPLHGFASQHVHRDASDGARTFNRLRQRLERIAYRMLGSAAEAEDIVQDTWLRWDAAARQEIENEEAWLISVTRRLSVDRLRIIKTQRERGSVHWFLGLQMAEVPATPQEINERADDLSLAYFVLLQRLTHEARAAFLLHEVFDADYDQIAKELHKAPDACRQLVRRARAQVRKERSRFFVPSDIHHHLFKRFVQVLECADFAEISAFLAEDAMLTGP